MKKLILCIVIFSVFSIKADLKANLDKFASALSGIKVGLEEPEKKPEPSLSKLTKLLKRIEKRAKEPKKTKIKGLSAEVVQLLKELEEHAKKVEKVQSLLDELDSIKGIAKEVVMSYLKTFVLSKKVKTEREIELFLARVRGLLKLIAKQTKEPEKKETIKRVSGEFMKLFKELLEELTIEKVTKKSEKIESLGAELRSSKEGVITAEEMKRFDNILDAILKKW